MPDFTFWDIVSMGLLLAGVQAGTHFSFEAVSKWFKKRKNNTVYELYINDELIGKHTLKECNEIYNRTPYKGFKGSVYTEKTKVFHITADGNSATKIRI